MEESDFNELIDLGLPVRWSLRNGVVWARSHGRHIGVARFLLDAKAGETVRYIDNDPTNLLRSNLVKTLGRSVYDARDRDSLIGALPRPYELILAFQE
jgi:hypothetical protein